MADEPRTEGAEQLRKLFDEFLAAAGPELENVVNTKAFGEMLGQSVSSLVATNRINNDSMDLLLRNLRIASRADVVSLHRQLARTEDKLEMVLEIVEHIHDELSAIRRQNADRAADTAAAAGSTAETE